MAPWKSLTPGAPTTAFEPEIATACLKLSPTWAVGSGKDFDKPQPPASPT